MPRLVRSCLAVASLVAVTACASGQGGGGDSVRRYGRATVSLEEIQAYAFEASNARDIVQRLRPDWLRAAEPLPRIAVFVGPTQFGWIESLSQISAPMIESIEYMDRGDINARFTSERANHIAHGIRIRRHESGGGGTTP